MPRVSIIMAAYNAAETIEDAIGSVLVQTEPDFELMVVDDGSRDATPDLAGDVARRDNRVRVIRTETNAGPGAARNRGMEKATGEWVGPFDADDRCHPERLERLLDLAGRTRADLVADNLMAWPAERPSTRAPLLPECMLGKEMRLNALTYIEGAMGRRGSRANYGFLHPLCRRAFLERHAIRYPGIRFSEDFVFALECLLAGAEWWLTPEPLYEYRISPTSLAVNHPIASLHELLAAERPLLTWPAVKRDPAIAAALRRHVRSVEKSRAWRAFAETMKRKDPVAAAAGLVHDRRHLLHIANEALRALLKVAKIT